MNPFAKQADGISRRATDPRASALAVLVSGGLDSAILLGRSLDNYEEVHPLYIRCGLYWESHELQHLGHFLEALQRPALKPLQVLAAPVGDLYGQHWSLSGVGVPGAETPDEAVFLPGRNLILLSKAILWCHLNGVPAVALAPLGSNPFPDATPEFFRSLQDVANQAVGGAVEVLLPYGRMEKTEVMHQGRDLPLSRTFSCIRPRAGHHCGTCNKCAERRKAFADAAIADATIYESDTDHPRRPYGRGCRS